MNTKQIVLLLATAGLVLLCSCAAATPGVSAPESPSPASASAAPSIPASSAAQSATAESSSSSTAESSTHSALETDYDSTINKEWELPEMVSLEKPGDSYQLSPQSQTNSDASFEYVSQMPDLFSVSDTGLITYLIRDPQGMGSGYVYVIEKATKTEPAQVMQVLIHAASIQKGAQSPTSNTYAD